MKIAAFLLSLLTLTGCCVAERCDCQDGQADTLALRFSRDSTGVGFRAAEIDSFYLCRFPLDSLDRPLRDSVLLTARAGTEGADFFIDQRRPFASNPRKATAYRYKVKGMAPDTFTVRLSDIHVNGQIRTATACCTCYENVRKDLRINGGPLLDLHTAPTDQPAIAELRKP